MSINPANINNINFDNINLSGKHDVKVSPIPKKEIQLIKNVEELVDLLVDNDYDIDKTIQNIIELHGTQHCVNFLDYFIFINCPSFKENLFANEIYKTLKEKKPCLNIRLYSSNEYKICHDYGFYDFEILFNKLKNQL